MNLIDKITELPLQNWTELRDKFTINWPEHQLGYLVIDDYIKWSKNEKYSKDFKIFTLNGNWSDGTFVLIDRYQLFIYTLNDINTNLLKLLRLLDWTNGFLISCFREKFLSTVLSIVKELNLNIDFDSETFVHFLPKTKSHKIDVIPDGFHLNSLSTWDHAKIANDVWPYKHDGSLYYLKRLIDLNPTIGLFRNDTNELVAWCFRFQSGLIGALQVKDSYMRRGFGTLIIKAMTKMLAEINEDSIALIADTNIPSKSAFKALNFKIIDCCHWIKIFPKDPAFKWNDFE